MPKKLVIKEISKDAVLKELVAQAAPDGKVSAQVFFEKMTEPVEVKDVAEAVVRQAEQSLGKPNSVTIRRVYTSANSASVVGDLDVIASLQSASGVKTVLPNAVTDIMPQPKNRKLL